MIQIIPILSKILLNPKIVLSLIIVLVVVSVTWYFKGLIADNKTLKQQVAEYSSSLAISEAEKTRSLKRYEDTLLSLLEREKALKDTENRFKDTKRQLEELKNESDDQCINAVAPDAANGLLK